MRIVATFFAMSLFGTLPALGQHHGPAHGHDRPHAHWHAPPETVKVAVALQDGGHVVFFRHGKTDMLAVDQHPLDDMTDCSKQRNLSPSGIAASREMGEAIKQLNIPIGTVLASPYRRCMDTARYAFGRVDASQDLLVGRTAHGWALEEAGERLKKLLAVPPSSGKNTVLVAHIFNVQNSLGLTPEEGEAVVFRPDGKGGYGMIGRVTATQWGDLVRDLVVFKMDPRALESGHGAQGAHGTHSPRHPHEAK